MKLRQGSMNGIPTRIKVFKTSPATIMSAPTRLADALSDYFTLGTSSDSPPTFEGLALAAGFSSFNAMKAAATNDKNPEDARELVLRACATVAHIYQQNGLLDKYSPPFVKYLLSAYLSISEKSITESNITDNKTITVQWRTEPPKAHPSHGAYQPTRQQIRDTATHAHQLEQELRELEIEDLL